MKDLFGKAILDYQTNNSPENLITETSISDEDEMSVEYLFRSFAEMPKIEQKALNMCFGKILDIGCGAGSHSLYLENEMNLEVTSIDISENAIKGKKMVVGQAYGGGIIFFVDNSGEHGLIASNDNGNSQRAKWGCDNTLIDETETGIGTGQENTKKIILICRKAGSEKIAARLCALSASRVMCKSMSAIPGQVSSRIT